ncbi:hypothetical protein F909_00889 [Acinetobacter sp. ANC 3929]|uniref:hypothetical protein n=1 Tax=unclassified Acinetobacter TaxID=196816 RepID=UPI0002CD6E4E|nr:MULTISPECIES: hypothetical protein [unclassified Acinetobacter]ENW82619.1 hypothetical protein F909_00889 [Acinetobacter sp. ANC 3929]MCH7356290.1 hypothetical protein [Acinetobacter sp. NIPH 1958]
MTNHNYSITSEEFVQEFKDLRDELIQSYFTLDSDISRIALLEKSGMNSEQINLTKKIVLEALTDALYTILLGLDGCTSIGRHQIMYRLFDEESNELTGNIELIAWEKFHSENT